MSVVDTVPKVITSGVIAAELHVPLHRVLRILATRPHIRPTARAGTLRLYLEESIAQVRHELIRVKREQLRRGVRDGELHRVDECEPARVTEIQRLKDRLFREIDGLAMPEEHKDTIRDWMKGFFADIALD